MWNVHHHLETHCEVPCVKNIRTFDQKREGVSFLWKPCNKAKLKFFLLQKTKEPFNVLGINRQLYSSKVLEWNSHLCFYTSNHHKVQLNTQKRHDSYIRAYTYKEVQNIGPTVHPTHTVLSDRTFQLWASKLSSHSSFLSLKTLSLLQVISKTPCTSFVWIRRMMLIYASQVEFHNSYKANITIQSN